MTREEAIDIIRKNIPHLGIGATKMTEALEALLPELRESEDEKIRKNCIHFLELQKQHHAATFEIEECIAWLEKQKEQPISAVEVLARAGLKPYKDGNQWCVLAGDNIQEGICGFGDTIDEALYQFLMEVLEKQKEQKPNYCHHEVDESGWTEEYRKAYYDGWNNCNMQHEQLKADQKTTEWSEEDKTRLTNILIMLQEYMIHHYSKDDVNKSVDWLKALPERFNLQPKQEWSKEDIDRMVNERARKSGTTESEMAFYCQGIKDTLKSLRPQPHWKPSASQMCALKVALETFRVRNSDNISAGNDKVFTQIESLYEQLKKL